MSNLRAYESHVQMLNAMAEYAGTSEPVLYYPGCGDDESPEHTTHYAGSTLYVDMFHETAIKAHKRLHREAFYEDATTFKPPEQPDAIVFFNPGRLSVGATIDSSSLKVDGLIGYMDQDIYKLESYIFPDLPNLAIRGVLVGDKIDENVADFKPMEDEEELLALYPKRYAELVQELHEAGFGDTDIRATGVLGLIKALELKLHNELVASQYADPYLITAHVFDVPSKRRLESNLVIAQKVTAKTMALDEEAVLPKAADSAA
ncbi:MAG TPA: hypothetical protein VLG27_01850 [Candidatus Saccharimonadia bacterium]|nr:hypothetical protein [Candidatus Saccharimonadia bacterium]